MTPTPGRIVLYKLDGFDVGEVNRRRDDALRHIGEHHENATGVIVHTGNSVREGDVLPAIITRVWAGAACNLQVLLDGNDTYWATSRLCGDEAGQWAWPTREGSAS